jgi:hypothetical protein
MSAGNKIPSAAPRADRYVTRAEIETRGWDGFPNAHRSNADFYNGYFAARVIVNRAASQHKETP